MFVPLPADVLEAEDELRRGSVRDADDPTFRRFCAILIWVSGASLPAVRIVST